MSAANKSFYFPVGSLKAYDFGYQGLASLNWAIQFKTWAQIFDDHNTRFNHSFIFGFIRSCLK